MATEKRLIRADVTVEAFTKWLTSRYDGRMPADIVDEIPTCDAVEVVRCKDCKYRKSTFNGDGYFCSVWDTDDYEEAYVKDNDFCSYGERRTDGR